MKNLFLMSASIVFMLGISSCSPDKTAEETAAGPASCVYSYDASSSVLEWTAFKFTEKKGVTGTFNEIKIEGLKSSDDPKKMIESLTFSIITASVETQNEERNGKIAKLFFGAIGTDEITGKVKSLSDNGKATLEIKMNNMSQDVVGEYRLIDGEFVFSGTIDVLKWNAGPGIASLNKACKELHTGADGVSKLWNEVAISFTTQLASKCD